MVKVALKLVGPKVDSSNNKITNFSKKKNFVLASLTVLLSVAVIVKHFIVRFFFATYAQLFLADR